MKNSELHTLKSILTEGIRIEGKETPIEISCVYIPKIQRAYAQGRKNESDIRKDFLNALFDVLMSEEEQFIELSFLFGSKQVLTKRNGAGFELLDGQQRTTTLFLLYWFVSMKEKKCVPEFLSKFTYDTRDTSTQFLSNITSARFTLRDNGCLPSDAIKRNKWFTDDYYCDPTVCAMLNMLDNIAEQYLSRKCEKIFDRLERLRFYVLMLEKFDMNDELYIKMNSRGLSLIPFENFKASIVKFMKAKERNELYGTDDVIDGRSPYWFDFISKIDSTWIDLFWKYTTLTEEESTDIIEIDDKLIGIRYLNFINRYLFTKTAIEDKLNNSKLNTLSDFLYNDAETEKMQQRLFGWEYYEKILSSNDYLRPLETVLDELHKNWETIKPMIANDPYGNVSGFDILGEKYTLQQRVIFAALTEFIEKIPKDNDLKTPEVNSNFKRMLRVVFNLIENTTVESPEAAIRLIKAVNEIIKVPGAITDNFYKCLANTNFNSRNQQLKEEIIKAKEMFHDGIYNSNWEDVFCMAEKHPFFKGSILFFFSPGSGTCDDFKARFNIVKDLFDANGITDNYRSHHILIRAIVGQINTWTGGLEGRYITEISENQKYLKILLTNYPAVRKMFCDFFDAKKDMSIKDYLNQKIISANPSENEPNEFKMLFKRLVNDDNADLLFDWFCNIEDNKKKYFCVQNNRCFLINIPGAWYDRVILDTERHKIIPELVRKYSMNYEDMNQKNMMERYKDTWGWHVRIYIENLGNNNKLLLDFNEWKRVDYYIYGENVDTMALLFNVSIEDRKKNCVKVHSDPYQYYDSIDQITKTIDVIIEKLTKDIK